jgi:hypothetical protein
LILLRVAIKAKTRESGFFAGMVATGLRHDATDRQTVPRPGT